MASNSKTLATNRGEEVVDNLVLLDRPEFGKNSKEKGSEHTEGVVEVERSKLKISSGLWPKHAVKEDLLERADAALLYEAAELGHRNPLILVVAAAPVIDR